MNTRISEPIRRIVRERNFARREEGRKAMVAFTGSSSDGVDSNFDSVEHIRSLRRGSRMDRIFAE
jgi:hypothetical protein